MAVEYRTTGKSPRREPRVNGAAMVRRQISAGNVGGLVETKSLVRIERRHHAAQSATPRAIHLQLRTHGSLLVKAERPKRRGPGSRATGGFLQELPKEAASLCGRQWRRQSCVGADREGTIRHGHRRIP